jgi:hypothetical protein
VSALPQLPPEDRPRRLTAEERAASTVAVGVGFFVVAIGLCVIAAISVASLWSPVFLAAAYGLLRFAQGAQAGVDGRLERD